MYLVTNREIVRTQGGPDILGKRPNRLGPNELRVVHARKRGRAWRLEVLPDKPTAAMLAETARVREAVHGPDGDHPEEPHIISYVTHKLLSVVNPQLAAPRSTRTGKNLLVFVHGFNNDVEDVLERSHKLARLYGVEILPFSWPANGGGVLSGAASYKSDKRDAKASVGALDRALFHISECLRRVSEQRIAQCVTDAYTRYPDNAEARNALVTRIAEKGCPFSVNLMTHSMGNYLYKHLLLSTASEGNVMLFDNVVLVAADTNNLNHAQWVDNIRCRKRVYVTINEDDRALQVSRLKSGSEQLARLGHYPFNLNARYAAYVQFTDARHVGSSHAYFEDAIENRRVRGFFKKALNGDRADASLTFDPASNTHRV